jgi:hypothetical protein
VHGTACYVSCYITCNNTASVLFAGHGTRMIVHSPSSEASESEYGGGSTQILLDYLTRSGSCGTGMVTTSQTVRVERAEVVAVEQIHLLQL